MLPPPQPLGATDCERIRDGRIAQPANTISSAALAVIGLGIVARGRLRSDPRRSYAFGSTVAAAGIGSVIYHGPGGRLGHWVHDATLASMVAFLPIDNLRALRSWRAGRALAAFGGASAAAGTLLAMRPSWVQELPTVLGVVGAATEVAARRRRPPAAGRLHRVSDGLWGLAFTSYVVGRTESPLCRPDSMLQPHGLWHMLAGAAVAVWAEAAFAEDA